MALLLRHGGMSRKGSFLSSISTGTCSTLAPAIPRAVSASPAGLGTSR
jgi:hypothetical protein